MENAIIDGYAHVGAPRFLALEDYRSAMEQIGVGRAMICPFENCADLVQVHSALAGDSPFRAFGLPMGRDVDEVSKGLHAQIDAGFEGVRVAQQRIGEVPEILDVLGERGAIPMVVGANGLQSQARRLLDFLERWPDAVIVSPHFAGPCDLSIFDTDPTVAALFDHPNFYVVYSRQSLFPQDTLLTWAQHLIDRGGWSRIMWGSELPVPFWRDEKLALLVDWIERFNPTPDQLAAFRTGNAERAVFNKPRRPMEALVLPFDPRELEIHNAAPMWPFGFPADTRLPARLVHEWMKAGGEAKLPLSEFMSTLMLEALDARR